MNEVCFCSYLRLITELLIDKYKKAKSENKLTNGKLCKIVTIDDYDYSITIRESQIFIEKRIHV